MKRHVTRRVFAAAAALTLLAACGSDSDDGSSDDSQEWYVQADFDEQNEQRDATFEGDPATPCGWRPWADPSCRR